MVASRNAVGFPHCAAAKPQFVRCLFQSTSGYFSEPGFVVTGGFAAGVSGFGVDKDFT
jgi:hypothetical protein